MSAYLENYDKGIVSISKLCLGSWGLQSTRSMGVLGQHRAIQE